MKGEQRLAAKQRKMVLMQEGDSCRNTNQSVHPKIDISPISWTAFLLQ